MDRSSQTLFSGMVVLLSLLFLPACGGGGGGGGGTDTIAVDRVSPAVVSAGTTTDYTIDISYDLQTSTNGVINIGFKPVSSNIYSLETDTRIVSRGSGTVQFIVNKTLNESHDLRALLSEYPHAQSWTPLDTDSYGITVN